MGLLSFIRSELIEIIEWLDESNQTLVWRFPDEDHNIKNGAQLVCRPGQAAIFVHEGRLGDLFGPGTYRLTTANLPVITKIANWKHGFDSPFKAEVYFVNLKQYVAQRWGTATPILIRDPDFVRGGRPGAVRFRGYGTYNFRISDPLVFFREVVGTKGLLRTEDIDAFLRSRVISSLASAAAKASISVMDMAAHYQVLADAVIDEISSSFTSLGLSLTSFIIESISLPPEVEKAIDAAAALSAQGINDPMAWEGMQAMRDAARNPSGGAGAFMNAGMGLGAGLGMGQMAADAFRGGPGYGGHAYGGHPGPAGPPPAPRSTWTPAPGVAVGAGVVPPATGTPGGGAGLSAATLTEKLTMLKAAFEAGLLTAEEYAAKKGELLAAF